MRLRKISFKSPSLQAGQAHWIKKTTFSNRSLGLLTCGGTAWTKRSALSRCWFVSPTKASEAAACHNPCQTDVRTNRTSGCNPVGFSREGGSAPLAHEPAPNTASKTSGPTGSTHAVSHRSASNIGCHVAAAASATLGCHTSKLQLLIYSLSAGHSKARLNI